jgi:hypothetical protein
MDWIPIPFPAPAGGHTSISTSCQDLCLARFFYKKYKLILRRCQLHSASATTQDPSGNTDAHDQNKKNNYKKNPATMIDSS